MRAPKTGTWVRSSSARWKTWLAAGSTTSLPGAFIATPWLSDRERGGYYGSQDADISLDDDGSHFTWTLDEARAVLDEDELAVAAAHYDIGEHGEMTHDPAKNVLGGR